LAKTAAIIGGGIIGINAAAALAEAGFAVTLFDRTGICEETSAGNAAALAFSEILPMAHKGFLRKVPAWLMDPLGPLTIAPNYLVKIMPWLLQVSRAGASSKRDVAIAAQASLMTLAEAEMMALVSRSGLNHMVREDGSLELYDGEAAYQASLPGWAFREKHGVPFEHVRGQRLKELQPGLSNKVAAATYAPSWKTVSDPKDFGKALWAYAEILGSRFVKAEAAIVRGTEDGARFVQKDGSEQTFNKVILCAGAWSHRLARQLGDVIPLETERGYNTTLPKTAFDAKRMLIFSSDAFVLTPLENGIRIGGAVELAGLENPPNFKRADAMLVKAKRYLPGLDVSGGTQWMGFRPSLPDTLPAIGRSKTSPHVLYAFGHGHLGLTQSAATGRLVRDLALGLEPPLDLTPFSPQRFA
jgi:D-amino-acid dehydrogenase